MPYNRGDIVLLLFPNSNLRTAKRRPALIVQADQLGTGLLQVVVAMISGNLDRAGHPSRVTVKHGTPYFAEIGLLSDSIILTDNLATVLESEVRRPIGRFAAMNEVDEALRHTLGL